MRLQQISLERLFIGTTGIAFLLIIYVYQRFDYATFLGLTSISDNTNFALNKCIRYILNDINAILLLWSIYPRRKVILLAFVMQLIGLFVLLPVYLLIKLKLEGPSEISSPLLSFLHRIIVNPILVLMLIPGIYLTNSMKQKHHN